MEDFAPDQFPVRLKRDAWRPLTPRRQLQMASIAGMPLLQDGLLRHSPAGGSAASLRRATYLWCDACLSTHN